MTREPNQPNKAEDPCGMHIELATHLQELGLFEAAISELEKARRATSDKLPIFRKLAELYRGQNQIDKAITTVKKVIKGAPHDLQARGMLIDMLLEVGELDTAIEESRALIRMNPRSINARDALYFAYLQKGMFGKALDAANEMIHLDPGSPVNHYKKAFAHHEKGDVGGTIHELSRVLEMQPDEEMAQDVQQAIEKLDSQQMRSVVMLAMEDNVFRTKLIHDPEAAVAERGYFLSYAGIAALKQIQFDELPEIQSAWKQRYYH